MGQEPGIKTGKHIPTTDILDKGMRDILSRTQQDSEIHHATRNTVAFKLMNLYFWNLPFNIFGLQLTTSKSKWTTKLQVKGEYCIVKSAFA